MDGADEATQTELWAERRSFRSRLQGVVTGTLPVLRVKRGHLAFVRPKVSIDS